MRVERLRLLPLLAVASGALGGGQPLPNAPSLPLRSLAQVLDLANDQAGHGYRFQLRAQVTMFEPGAYWFFLQDGSNGIYAILSDKVTPPRAGDWVEADGLTRRGGFAPILDIRALKVLSNSPRPEPIRPGDTGQNVSEAGNLWAVAEGRVLSAESAKREGFPPLILQLRLASGERLPLRMGSSSNCDPGVLVDAKIIAHGVLGTMVAGAENRRANALFVAGCQAIDVIAPAREQWSLPVIELRRILTYKSGTKIDDMVHVRGVVTFIQRNGQVFVQEGRSGMLVEPIEPGAAGKIGDKVEVLGRVMQDQDGTRRVVAARMRPSSAVEPVEVRKLSEEELWQPKFVSALVSVEGILTAREIVSGRALFSLRIGDGPLTAEMPLSADAKTGSLPEVGDGVKFVGIARVLADGGDYSVRLQLRSPADIQILTRRPFAQRVAWGQVALAVSGLMSCAFFWVWALRNRVRARTRQLEEANQRAEKARVQAEEASRAKGEFLANMSHEIRTPMNGVLGAVELVLGTNLSGEQRDLVETAMFSASGLLTIINDILDYSKIEAGKLELDPVTFSLRSLLQRAAKAHSVAAAGKGLKLTCNIRPEVPDLIVSDSNRLAQILANLLGNAVKFTAAGEINVEVGLDGLTGSAARLHFSVRDTGIGIPASKQQSIFEAFSQADASTTRRFGGTGLGLTISSKLVQMLGGNLWVESELGRGSRFHFAFAADLPVLPSGSIEPSRVSRGRDSAADSAGGG